MKKQKNVIHAKFAIEFFAIWTVIFIVLKLLDILRLPWFWIFAPAWIPVIYIVCMIFFTIVIALILSLFKRR